MRQLTDLDFDQVRQGVEDGSMLLVDVRELYEFEAGHIPGSVAMPLSRFVPAELPEAEGRRIVFLCKAGVRSAQAVALMQQAGSALHEHYRGSFSDWLACGGPVAVGLES